MKKLCLVFTVMLTILLAACGEMSQEDVVQKLASNLEGAEGYLATGIMEIDSEGQMYQYQVEIAFKHDNYYRVTLRNETTNNEQIILKNDDGVFVLTPSLNKQFKFQSEWPLSSSQVYLYQSLLRDIMNDEEATFTVEENSYLFETTAEYHGNRDLVRQTIRFDKKTLAPTEVAVMDSEGVVRISMTFDTFEFNPTFDEGHFNAEAVMESAQTTMGDGVLGNIDLGDVDLSALTLPEGTELLENREVGERTIMTFGGDQDLTIIKEPASVREVVAIETVMGDPIMINGMVGTMNNNSLSWVSNGIEFFLVSNTLEADELVSVATSISTIVQK